MVSIDALLKPHTHIKFRSYKPCFKKKINRVTCSKTVSDSLIQLREKERLTRPERLR